MNAVSRQFSNQFQSHWIGVKFYKEKPDLKNVKKLQGVRFCEATKRAIIHPILLDKDSISCSGAQCAFAWDGDSKGRLKTCLEKNSHLPLHTLQSMLSQTPRLSEPFQYIGLNTQDSPDVVVSYVSPEQSMHIVRIYNNCYGVDLDVSLRGMMSICGGIAVKSYLTKKISFSFGCEESRKFANLSRDTLAVGIPEKYFDLFLV